MQNTQRILTNQEEKGQKEKNREGSGSGEGFTKPILGLQAAHPHRRGAPAQPALRGTARCKHGDSWPSGNGRARGSMDDAKCEQD